MDNISFEINRGEKVALVGVNGSGKSTLSKLILGLYKPDKGEVITEKSKTVSSEDRRTAIFQEYAKYKLSVEENVRISDFDKMESAQSKIDLFSKDIKVDLQTILGREFGNMELSGGQWQSLAIARGFYRDATLLVLDEPTAAIDPIKEDYYYTLFRQELKDKQVNPGSNGKLKKAITYIKNCQEYLMTYLEDGRCSLSNNLSENAIRPVTVGRKNWLFSDTAEGAKANALYLTIVEMAKTYNLNLYDYLKFLFEHRPNKDMSDEEFENLAPWNEHV